MSVLETPSSLMLRCSALSLSKGGALEHAARLSRLVPHALRGNADRVGIAPQDEGFKSCRQPRQQSGALE
jgi:hypothetical protein